MSSAPPTIAWVLGAGFSRSLGGPLLQEFFSQPLLDRIDVKGRPAQDGRNRWDGLFQQFEMLTRLFGVTDDRSGPDGDEPWRDAEEFVEFLDLASGNAHAQALIDRVVKRRGPDYISKAGALSRNARTYLALACHSFVETGGSLAQKRERWAPYVRWGNSVCGHGDAVISFNYDRVVELATKERYRPLLPSGTRPAHSFESGHRFVKLHGSVDWLQVRGDNRAEETSDVYEAAMAHRDFYIATPGDAKLEMTSGPLADVWARAKDHLRTAETIVFIGYRFPPTDAKAREELLAAISENSKSQLVIHIVLGPRASDDVLRLEGLLRWSLSHRTEVPRGEGHPEPCFSLVREPLWAEDFLSVFERSALLPLHQNR